MCDWGLDCAEAHAGLSEDRDLLITFLPGNWQRKRVR